MRRRSVEIVAAIGLIVFVILFYQFYLQNIVILYVGDKNYSELLQKGNIKVQGNTFSVQNTAKGNKPQVIEPVQESPVKQQTDAPAPIPVEKVPIELPSKPDIEKLNAKEASSLYEKYVITKQAYCKIVRLGNVQDGGWDICSDSGYEPRTNGSCLVYSVGMRRKDFKRSEKVFFHNTGLSNTNNSHNGWKMRTFFGLRKDLGHSKSPIDVLKVDIEQWEQVTIPEMVANGSLKDVKQFAVEIHIDLGHITRKQDPRREKYIQVLKGLRDLFDAGFRIAHFHCNPYCRFKFKSGKGGCSCHELLFINTKLKSNKS